MIFLSISLHCKLVPVQYREYEYGQFAHRLVFWVVLFVFAVITSVRLYVWTILFLEEENKKPLRLVQVIVWMKVQLRICTASDISKILTNFYEHLGQFNLKEFSNITNGINPKKCLSFHAITYLPHDREARQFALRRTVKINDKLACSQPITVKYYAKLQVMCFSLLSTTFYFTFITIKTIPINKY